MLWKDLIYASRTLRKSPVFTVTAVATIALGIGASTAIFSVANAVLLRPLPYKDPERLVLGSAQMRRRGITDQGISATDFLDLRNGSKNSFEDFTAVLTFPQTMPRADGTLEQLHTALVATNFFRVLGGNVLFGRDFIDADGQPQPPQPQAAPGAPAPQRLPNIAILSYEYWQRRYGGNTAILGRGMLNGGNGGPQVVGILAPRFELLFPPSLDVERAPDLWIAARMAYDNMQRNTYGFRPIGRLKPGASLTQARAEAETVSAGIRKANPIAQTADYHLRLEPMQQHLTDEVRPAILALMGAVIFLLLIACANVANLLLVRSSLRERELAVRTALGGGWARLMAQMLTEALLLAGLGTIFGLALAWFGIHELLVIAPANLPRLDSISIDPAVLAFTALAGLAAAAIFGMVPAWRASRPDVIQALRASGRTAGLGGGGLLRNAVVVAGVALSFVLLIGSGLMFRSFLALQRIDPGYDPHNLLTFSLLGGGGAPAPEKRAATMREIHVRLSAIPGVQSVTASTPFPLTGGFSTIRWGKPEALSDSSKYQATDFQVVLPGYFDTMRTRLIAGRAFTETDNAPERNGVVIDQALAAKAFPFESAVGKRILTRVRTPEAEWVEILGVVAHQRVASLADPGREQIYFMDGFLRHGAVTRWALRTAGDPARYSVAIRAEIAKINRTFAVTEMQTMDALVERAQGGTRFSLLLIGVFAAIAALLAGVGLYGVLSTVVRQRTSEIGVRMALGAAPGSIFSLVVGHGLQLSAAGIAAGVVAALALTRVMTSMLVGVKATDPVTFVVMAALFFAIAGVASWLPARRASGLDPNSALRVE